MSEENLKKTQQAENTAGQQDSESGSTGNHWDIRPYLSAALTVIFVVVVCMVIFFIFLRFDGLKEAVSNIFTILQSVIIGLVVAYLINPIMTAIEKRIKKPLSRTKLKESRRRGIARGISAGCALGIFLLVIVVLLILIIPQLIESIQELVTSMEDKLNTLLEWVGKFTKDGGALGTMLNDLAVTASDYITEWLQDNILNTEFIESITTGVYNILKVFFNIIVGIIVAIYILMKKEMFVGQTKKLIYTIFKPRWGNHVIEVLRKSNSVFSGFFIGKIIDSVIIGFICFVVLYLMNMPYTVLVSTIVGITNIIPVFGPYIGAIPCFLLIFLVSPVKGIQFLIFIVILQQFDGNILGPKILGDSTGLSAFWVIFAILLFGGLFGIIGMIVGVPVFAVIYYIVRRIANHFLAKAGLPVASKEYLRIEEIDPKTNGIIYKEPGKRRGYVAQQTSRFWKFMDREKSKKRKEAARKKKETEE